MTATSKSEQLHTNYDTLPWSEPSWSMQAVPGTCISRTCSSLNGSTVGLPGSHLRTSVTKLFWWYSLAGNLGTVQQPQEQCYPFLSVCSIFVCSDNVSGMTASVWDFQCVHRC